SGVPARCASRSMSPVEICGTPKRSPSRRACVPLPAPGGPIITTRIYIRPKTTSSVGVLRDLATRVARANDVPRPAKPARHTWYARVVSNSPGAIVGLAAASDAAAFHEAFVAAGDHVRLERGQGVERDADDDQERGAAEVEGDAEAVDQDGREHAD